MINPECTRESTVPVAKSIITDDKNDATGTTSNDASPHLDFYDTEHVRIAKEKRFPQRIWVQSASPCCQYMVDFALECEDGKSFDEEIPLYNTSFKQTIDPWIVSLNVNLTKIPFNGINIEPDLMKEERKCIASVLKCKQRPIYFVVSNIRGEFVIPCIHNHPCIRNIYVYEDRENNSSTDWMNDFAKIRFPYYSIDKINQEIQKDMNAILHRPSRWSRSKALLTQLCTQTTQNSFSFPDTNIREKDLETIRIYHLNLSTHRLFHLTHPKIRTEEFNNIQSCKESISRNSQSVVFLVIDMQQIIDIESVVELQAVYAIYLVIRHIPEEEYQKLSRYSKLSGVYTCNENLLQQLINDICFYAQSLSHVSKLSVLQFRGDILGSLTQHEKDFLSFQLFTDILPQLPFSSELESNADPLSIQLIKGNSKIHQLFNKFNESTLAKSVPDLQRTSKNIKSLSTPDTMTTRTLYRVQLISENDFMMIQEKCNNLLSLRTFVIASDSFDSIVDICQKAANNQLKVILLEFDLANGVNLARIDSESRVFNLGTIFRIVSIDATPNGIWRARLKVIIDGMLHIKNQLEYRINCGLTWLTFGNFLSALSLNDEAEKYYDHLSKTISDGPSLSSIYNSRSVMYAAQGKHESALEWFDKALKESKASTSFTGILKDTEKSDSAESSTNQSFELELLNKMAAVSYKQGDYSLAIDCYYQAIESTNDMQLRTTFQRKIDSLLPLL